MNITLDRGDEISNEEEVESITIILSRIASYWTQNRELRFDNMKSILLTYGRAKMED